MRILIVTQYYWPEEFLVNDFAVGLKQRGHHVEVLTGLPNYPNGAFYRGYSIWGPMQDEHLGMPIWRCPVIPRGNGSGVRLALNYLSFAFFSSFRALSALQGKFDIILVYQLSPVTIGVPGLVFKKKSGGKLVLWIQDLWPESLAATGGVQSAEILRLMGTITRWIYRRSDQILVQSRAFKEPIARRGVDVDRIHYLPNFAEGIFDRSPRMTLGPGSSKPNEFRIMFAGNIGAAQDFRTIVEAAELTREHSGLLWLVVGDGRRKAWLAKEICDRRLDNIRLLGRFPKEEMPNILAKADVLLVSLRRDPLFALTIPSKIQAYLACGKPILASLDGEAARVIDEAGAGLTVPAENPGLLASAAVRFSHFDKDRLEAMGQNAQNYYQLNFARAHIIDEFEKLTSSLLMEF